MAKIESYQQATQPLSFSDMLIGTDVLGPIPNATKNFSLTELYTLFATIPNVGNLQDTLNVGNSATQDILLNGIITCNSITPTFIEDYTLTTGIAGQFLQSSALGIIWATPSVPNLQSVLNSGNTATQDIFLTGNISLTKVIPLQIQDSTSSTGSVGQSLFVSVGGLLWANPATVTSISTSGLISGGPITTTGTISTSMTTNKLVGRSTIGTGIMEEITVGTGLSLSAGTLTASGTSPLTTKGDLYTYDTTNARLPIGLDTQILLADSSTTTGLKWGTNTAATPLGYYGAFSDVTDQFATVINTGYPMLLGVTDLTNGVTVVSSSRITIANTGIYNIQWSAQFRNPTANEHDVTIWLRKNGVDVPGSAGIVLVPKKHGLFDGHNLPSWNFLLDVVSGDYYEFVWSTQDTAVFISFEAGGSPPPSTASVVLTVTQQSGIMAGTGITAINSLTGAVQTMAAGTSGTDFAVSSVGTTHTLNLPSSSAINRGALTAADWTTFNNKGIGSVTSVALTVPSAFSVTGSPITSSGTLAITGVGLGSQYIDGTGALQAFPSVGSGTVTSVAATVPTFLSVSGSPITTSGTLAVTLSGTALPVLNGGTGVTTSTGSGNTVLSTSPTLVTPILGSASATALTFTSTAVSGLTINRLTTTQRQALTPVMGDVVYDTTIGTTCTYNGTFWEYSKEYYVTANATTTSTLASTITGLTTFILEANSTYDISGEFLIQCSATGGIKFGNTLPAGGASLIYYAGVGTSGATTQQISSSNGTLTATAINRFANSSYLIFGGLIATVATAGTVSMQFASSVGGQTSTILGSFSLGYQSKITLTKIA